jgi:hypothetical protein
MHPARVLLAQAQHTSGAYVSSGRVSSRRTYYSRTSIVHAGCLAACTLNLRRAHQDKYVRLAYVRLPRAFNSYPTQPATVRFVSSGKKRTKEDGHLSSLLHDCMHTARPSSYSESIKTRRQACVSHESTRRAHSYQPSTVSAGN